MDYKLLQDIGTVKTGALLQLCDNNTYIHYDKYGEIKIIFSSNMVENTPTWFAPIVNLLYRTHHGQNVYITDNYLVSSNTHKIHKLHLKELYHKINLVDAITTDKGYAFIQASDTNTYTIGLLKLTILDIDNILKLFPKT